MGDGSCIVGTVGPVPVCPGYPTRYGKKIIEETEMLPQEKILELAGTVEHFSHTPGALKWCFALSIGSLMPWQCN